MKKELKLGLMITTMNEEISKTKKYFLKYNKECIISISHQITNKKIKPEKINLNNISYSYMFEKGLSKNRNNALKYLDSDIVLICDDDVKFDKNFKEKILSAYKKYPNSDIITFQISMPNGELMREYSKKSFIHSNLSILSVSSICITFKKKSFEKNNLNFDQRYGLGAKYCVGEENILLKDAINKGLILRYVPKSIVIHPKESSGSNWRDSLIISRVVVFKRMYGFLGGFFAVLYFTIMKFNLYKKKYSFFKFFKLSFKGLFLKK
jgi:GT2 family glycosyltransferase